MEIVDDDAEHVRLGKAEGIERTLYIAFIRPHIPTDEKRAVGDRDQRERVGNQLHGRRIVNDIIELFFQLFRKSFHRVAFQEFVRAGGLGALINDVEIFVLFGLMQDFFQFRLTGEVVAQSRLMGILEILRNSAFSDIRVDKNHFEIGRGEHLRQIDGNRRLAFFGKGGGGKDADAALLLFWNGYGKRSFKIAEGFGNGERRFRIEKVSLAQRVRMFLFVIFLLFVTAMLRKKLCKKNSFYRLRTFFRFLILRKSFDAGNNSQNGQSEFTGNILVVAQTVVGSVDDHDDHARDDRR